MLYGNAPEHRGSAAPAPPAAAEKARTWHCDECGEDVNGKGIWTHIKMHNTIRDEAEAKMNALLASLIPYPLPQNQNHPYLLLLAPLPTAEFDGCLKAMNACPEGDGSVLIRGISEVPPEAVTKPKPTKYLLLLELHWGPLDVTQRDTRDTLRRFAICRVDGVRLTCRKQIVHLLSERPDCTSCWERFPGSLADWTPQYLDAITYGQFTLMEAPFVFDPAFCDHCQAFPNLLTYDSSSAIRVINKKPQGKAWHARGLIVVHTSVLPLAGSGPSSPPVVTVSANPAVATFSANPAVVTLAANPVARASEALRNAEHTLQQLCQSGAIHEGSATAEVQRVLGLLAEASEHLSSRTARRQTESLVRDVLAEQVFKVPRTDVETGVGLQFGCRQDIRVRAKPGQGAEPGLVIEVKSITQWGWREGIVQALQYWRMQRDADPSLRPVLLLYYSGDGTDLPEEVKNAYGEVTATLSDFENSRASDLVAAWLHGGQTINLVQAVMVPGGQAVQELWGWCKQHGSWSRSRLYRTDAIDLPCSVDSEVAEAMQTD